jgi:hypothetical protein
LRGHRGSHTALGGLPRMRCLTLVHRGTLQLGGIPVRGEAARAVRWYVCWGLCPVVYHPSVDDITLALHGLRWDMSVGEMGRRGCAGLVFGLFRLDDGGAWGDIESTSPYAPCTHNARYGYSCKVKTSRWAAHYIYNNASTQS